MVGGPASGRENGNPRPAKSRAWRFVVLLGVVSLFADMTYEGARSIAGPFLAMLGASGAAVGLVAGFGEMVGYALRLASGYLVDRTRQYWGIAIIGYTVNLMAVPALALAGSFEVAALLLIAERTGKALRNPARDVMLSHAASQVGRGFGFGLHEALDQVGAILGPLGASAVLAWRGDLREAFAWLGVFAALALGTLLAARITFPNPREMEAGSRVAPGGLGRPFWVYLAAAALVAAGYADFPLIAFRLKQEAIVSEAWIPALYAVAMGVDAVAALVFGRLFDRHGLSVLAVAVVVSAAFVPLVFLGGFALVVVGMALWGIGMGAQESILRAAVADLVPPEQRGTAYGIFNAGYGVAWFGGSALIGVLYDASVAGLIAFSLGAQVLAVPVLVLARRHLATTPPS